MDLLFKNESYTYNFNIGYSGAGKTVKVILRDPYGVITEYDPSVVNEEEGTYTFLFEDQFTNIGQWAVWYTAVEGSVFDIGDRTIVAVHEPGSGIVTRDFVKEWLEILDTTSDKKIDHLIPLIENDYRKIRCCDFDTDLQGNNVYPLGSDVTASEMIGFKLNDPGESKAVVSERIGTYSISYDGKVGLLGYPTDIIASIERFITGGY